MKSGRHDCRRFILVFRRGIGKQQTSVSFFASSTPSSIGGGPTVHARKRRGASHPAEVHETPEIRLTSRWTTLSRWSTASPFVDGISPKDLRGPPASRLGAGHRGGGGLNDASAASRDSPFGA